MKVAASSAALILKSYATPAMVAPIIVKKFQFALLRYPKEALFAGLEILLRRKT